VPRWTALTERRRGPDEFIPAVRGQKSTHEGNAAAAATACSPSHHTLALSRQLECLYGYTLLENTIINIYDIGTLFPSMQTLRAQP
jgi:hypothetical protein